ncbi:MAG: type I-C CRISPR-associated protein Cas8c/Csd1 [Coriobacteriales bacterium]|nr:type I-C CRISPR-associated protein Cas8c/Csd1 [Coriobacteriales bacterium]
MILSELYNYYLRLLGEDHDVVPRKGWSNEKVSWKLPIGDDGSLGEPIFLGEEGKDGPKYKYMMVPEHVVRAGIKPIPFFLCDTAAYLLGLDDKNGAVKRKASCERHLELLSTCAGPEAARLRAFFRREDVMEDLSDAARESLAQGGACVLSFAGGRCAHEVPEIMNAWDSSQREGGRSGRIGQCGITGETGKLARLFPQVTGIPGAQSSGASLVSFNQQSFESYGKKQSYNASLSDSAAFGAGTALKYLFQDDRHRIRLGSMTVVFWADREAPVEDALMLELLGGAAAASEDARTRSQVEAALKSIRISRRLVTIDTSVRYFVLGVSPNAARLVARFFEVGTLGELAENYGWYLRDIDIVRDAGLARQNTSLLTLLRQTALLGKDENLPAPLVNPCFRAMLRGTRFPASLETALLSRMRADHGANNRWDMMDRASLMKACLVRKQRLASTQAADKESEVTVALNRNNENVGYLLGRLFAVMERAQQGAQGANLNATIRDKYMGSAATTPARVYGNLLGLCQKHVGAMRRDAANGWLVRRVEREFDEIFGLLAGGERPIPATLGNDDQLMFYVGYYQERVDLWTKRLQDDEQSGSSNDEEE